MLSAIVTTCGRLAKSDAEARIRQFILYGAASEIGEMPCGKLAGGQGFLLQQAEANEAAIKLARKYAKMHAGEEKFEIITALRSFHGRTLATLTATARKNFTRALRPIPRFPLRRI